MFRPQSSSLFQAFLAWLAGTPPEYADPKFAATGEARSVTRVESVGTVKVVFDVVITNLTMDKVDIMN
eukprot:SAG31_NODE_24144_length_488_cov_0.917738_1_plen_68_part_00